MKKIHCDGCGLTESIEVTKSKIKTIVVMVVNDPRFPEGTVKHEADLCPTCQGTMLHTYFNLPAEGNLEVPAFIGPRRMGARR